LAWTLADETLALRASDVCPPAPSQVGDVGPGQAALDQERAQELMRRCVRHRIVPVFIDFNQGNNLLD
jgi:hypothetical protein